MRHAAEARPTAGVPATLRAARAYAAMSREDMADRAGVKPRTLQRWETGERATWSHNDLVRIAMVAGWPLTVFFELADEGEPNHPGGT